MTIEQKNYADKIIAEAQIILSELHGTEVKLMVIHKLYSKEKIIATVEEATGYKIKEIIKKHRPIDVVISRHILCFYLRKYTGMTYKKIGEEINRDHTTSIYGKRNVENMIFTKEPRYMKAIIKVQTLLSA